MKLNVTDIVVANRYRKDMGDLTSLRRSIEKLGMLQPIGVREDDDGRHHLVFGGRRVAVHRELGWETIEVRVVDLDNPLLAERDENAERKDLLPTEMAAIAEEIERLEREKAQARKEAGRRHEAMPADEKGRARDKVAEKLGTSGKNLQKIQAVVKAAKEDPTLQPVVEEMDATGKVDPAHKKVTALKKAKKGRSVLEVYDTIHAAIGRIEGPVGELWTIWGRDSTATALRVLLSGEEGYPRKVGLVSVRQEAARLAAVATRLTAISQGLLKLHDEGEPSARDENPPHEDDQVPPPLPVQQELHPD
jgi:ParB-like chromosome segregation protein Spo0J